MPRDLPSQDHVEGPHTFVVRLWFEPTAALPDGGEWRGSARDTLSGSVAHFRHLAGLVGALRQLRHFAP